MILTNPPAIPAAISGDPWAAFDKMSNEPLDNHQRRQIKQSLRQFFEVLAQTRIEAGLSLLKRLESKT